jgi:hypothetical protein
MTAAWQFPSVRACCQAQLYLQGRHLQLLLQQQVPVWHWQQQLLCGQVLGG